MNALSLQHHKYIEGMKRMIFAMTMMLAASVFAACSDDDTSVNTTPSLYAVVKPEGAQLTDIMPEDYVLTLDNIIAVNPETGEFLLKDVKRMDEVAYPIPTQYVVVFYSDGNFLFDAKLNSALSSYLPTGLTFCHFLTDKSGVGKYVLGATYVTSQDGKTEGHPTKQQASGMQRMYRILQVAGKVNRDIDDKMNF